MCYVIVTIRSLCWTLLSVAVCCMHLMAIMSPYWLWGPEEEVVEVDRTHAADNNATTICVTDEIFTPSLGIFTRCIEVQYSSRLLLSGNNCYTYARRLLELPSGFWVVMMIFYGSGYLVLCGTAVASVLSLCVRSCCRKSLFTVTGFIQAIAGLLILLGLIMYPFGWGSDEVKELCGERATAFLPGDCGIGWGLLLAVGSLVLTFLCPVISVQAEFATASDEVENEVSKGKHLVCLP